MPYAGKLIYEGSGITYRIEEVYKQYSVSCFRSYKEHRTNKFQTYRNKLGSIPIRLQEPNKSCYSITIVNGKAIEANQLFGRTIQGMD